MTRRQIESVIRGIDWFSEGFYRFRTNPHVETLLSFVFSAAIISAAVFVGFFLGTGPG